MGPDCFGAFGWVRAVQCDYDKLFILALHLEITPASKAFRVGSSSVDSRRPIANSGSECATWIVVSREIDVALRGSKVAVPKLTSHDCLVLVAPSGVD